MPNLIGRFWHKSVCARVTHIKNDDAILISPCCCCGLVKLGHQLILNKICAWRDQWKFMMTFDECQNAPILVDARLGIACEKRVVVAAARIWSASKRRKRWWFVDVYASPTAINAPIVWHKTCWCICCTNRPPNIPRRRLADAPSAGLSRVSPTTVGFYRFDSGN